MPSKRQAGYSDIAKVQCEVSSWGDAQSPHLSDTQSAFAGEGTGKGVKLQISNQLLMQLFTWYSPK